MKRLLGGWGCPVLSILVGCSPACEAVGAGRASWVGGVGAAGGSWLENMEGKAGVTGFAVGEAFGGTRGVSSWRFEGCFALPVSAGSPGSSAGFSLASGFWPKSPLEGPGASCAVEPGFWTSSGLFFSFGLMGLEAGVLASSKWWALWSRTAVFAASFGSHFKPSDSSLSTISSFVGMVIWMSFEGCLRTSSCFSGFVGSCLWLGASSALDGGLFCLLLPSPKESTGSRTFGGLRLPGARRASSSGLSFSMYSSRLKLYFCFWGTATDFSLMFCGSSSRGFAFAVAAGLTGMEVFFLNFSFSSMRVWVKRRRRVSQGSLETG